LFIPDAAGRRPALGEDPRFARDPHWQELVLFHEFFHGDTGAGLGANHQTGWTALVARLIEQYPTKPRSGAAAGRTQPGFGTAPRGHGQTL
jgi:hypothetical protein